MTVGSDVALEILAVDVPFARPVLPDTADVQASVRNPGETGDARSGAWQKRNLFCSPADLDDPSSGRCCIPDVRAGRRGVVGVTFAFPARVAFSES